MGNGTRTAEQQFPAAPRTAFSHPYTEAIIPNRCTTPQTLDHLTSVLPHLAAEERLCFRERLGAGERGEIIWVGERGGLGRGERQRERDWVGETDIGQERQINRDRQTDRDRRTGMGR